MKPLRLGILLSGGGTTLENIAAVIARGELNAQIVCVIASNGYCFGIERARGLDLPVHIITRKTEGSDERFSQRIAQTLRDHRVDLVLMAGFLSLWQIPPDFAGKVMNIHPALLPKFGGKGMHGLHVHAAVLAAKETESGCTVHFADNTYDNGPIILQRRVKVAAEDTAESLAKRVFEAECHAYPAAVRWWGENVLERDDNRVFMRKVLAYITREKDGRRELLVFDHVHAPEAGVQVPHGTMHHGEEPVDALMREVREETGLEGLTILSKIGVFDWINPEWGVLFQRHVFHLHAPAHLPDMWEHYETDGGRNPELREYLFRFRWHLLGEALELAGGQGAYLGPLVE